MIGSDLSNKLQAGSMTGWQAIVTDASGGIESVQIRRISVIRGLYGTRSSAVYAALASGFFPNS
jgi:hypothetical protein